MPSSKSIIKLQFVDFLFNSDLRNSGQKYANRSVIFKYSQTAALCTGHSMYEANQIKEEFTLNKSYLFQMSA